MPNPSDATSEVHERALADLPSVALGEQPEPGLVEHLTSCPSCRAELTAYERVAVLGRLGGRAGTDGSDDVLPPSLWRRIEAAATTPGAATQPAAATPASGPADYVPAHRVAEDPEDAPTAEPPAAETGPAAAAPAALNVATRRAATRWHRPVIAAAAAVLIAAAAVGGWAVGRSSSSSTPQPAAPVALAAQPGTAADVHGTATMHTTDAGLTMEISTAGLPAPEGYYEVWLFDPSANRMVAVGTLGSGGRGLFTMPSGIDLHAYHVVDVSAQRYNGNPAHQRSVLRGQLPT